MSKVKKDKKRCKSNHKKGINLTSNSSKNKILRTKETKKWSSDEDKLLTNLVRSQKYQNFSEISKKIPGHSNTQCRQKNGSNVGNLLMAEVVNNVESIGVTV